MHLNEPEEKLCRLVSGFSRVRKRRKLRVTVGEKQVMECSKKVDASIISVRLNGELLEGVQWFKYLYSHVETTGLVGTRV